MSLPDRLSLLSSRWDCARSAECDQQQTMNHTVNTAVQLRTEFKVCAAGLQLSAPGSTNLPRRNVHTIIHSYLHSVVHGNLLVPRSRTTRYGQRSFTVSGPTLWNSLLWTADDSSPTVTQFWVHLKTVLFSRV